MTRISPSVDAANVGDLLWYRADIWRPCPWVLLPVRKVGRINIFVGSQEEEHTWTRFRLDKLQTNNSQLAGVREREVDYWIGQVRGIEKKLRATKDIEQLRDVAFVLGFPKAPDFSDPEQGR